MPFPVINQAKAEAIQAAINADTVLANAIQAEITSEIASVQTQINDTNTRLDGIDSSITNINLTLATNAIEIAGLSSNLSLLTARVVALELDVPLKVNQADYDIVIADILAQLNALK